MLSFAKRYEPPPGSESKNVETKVCQATASPRAPHDIFFKRHYFGIYKLEKKMPHGSDRGD